MINEQFGLVVPKTPAVAIARSRWMAAMIPILSGWQLRKAIESANRATSVHIRVIGRLVILAEWRETEFGTSYYHVLYTWSAAK